MGLKVASVIILQILSVSPVGDILLPIPESRQVIEQAPDPVDDMIADICDDSVQDRVAAEVRDAGDRHGIDPALIAAIITVESTCRPLAQSRRGAVGLMQVKPTTAGLPRRELQKIDKNIEAGTRYLASQIRRFRSIEHGLAAYNAGPAKLKCGRSYARKVLRKWRKLKQG